MMMSSLTRWPASMTALACRPRGVPRFTASRRRSPVANLGSPRASASNAPCVPFPAPGGPISRMSMCLQDGSSELRTVSGATQRYPVGQPRSLFPLTAHAVLHVALLPASELDSSRLHEPVVLAQGPVLLDLCDRVEQHADHDQHRRAAEARLHVNPLGYEDRDERDPGQEESS